MPDSVNNFETTTQLNAGSGGDKMDETAVLQTDGVTTGKRPRVVLGTDDGKLVNKANPLYTEDIQMLDMLKMILEELQMIRSQLE